MRIIAVIWLCLPLLRGIDDTWRPNVSQSIQRSANRSKWRSSANGRRLQVPGFNTRRSELCQSHGQSVTRPEVVPLSLELCSYCRGPELDPCVYDVSECSGISQGGACRIRCKVPYLGASREAICPSSGKTGSQDNLTFRLPSCTAALEQDEVSCPNPPEIPSGYRQVQETGEWVCAAGYHGTALRQCTLLRMGDACLLQAIFSGCLPLVPCLPPEPTSDYEGQELSEVPACGYDTSGCENVQNGQSCQIRCRDPFSGPPVTARCPETNTDPNQKLIYSLPACQKICPNPSVVEAGLGYAYDLLSEQWSCTPMYTGRAVKFCEIDSECQRRVEMIGCLPKMPCAAPDLDPCRYDWSSCGDFSAGTSCEISCRAPYEGDGFPTFCPANNSNQTSPLQFEIPWCALTCQDPLPLPDGYIRQGSDYKCAVGYTGIAERSCLVNPDCTYEVTFQGCSKLVPCKALPPLPPWPEPGNRCELDISECQQPVPLGSSCEAKCRPPFGGNPRSSTCPSRNTDPERTVDFLSPFCRVETCPEPIPMGYAKTSRGYSCATGYGGSVLSSCTECGRLVLTGCYTAIPCKALQVQDNCLHNVTDCSSPIGAGETCTVTCGNAYQGEPTIATCPSDNIDVQGEVVVTLPRCSLYCPDPDPMPAGYDIFTDYLGRREIRCAPGYVGIAQSQCVLLAGCRSELQLTGCLKLEPCLPLAIPHAERYDMTGCDRVMPGSSCRISCRPPWMGPEAVARCPENNIKADEPLILPEEIRMDRHGVFYNTLWPPKCTLRCDSVPVGYEKVQEGRWRCAPGFHGTVGPKSCNNRGQCREALQLEGCSELIPCTIPALDACRYDVSDCNGFQRGTSCEVKCRSPYNGTAAVLHCPVNNTETSGGLIGELPDCVIEECVDPDVIPSGYVPVDAANGLWSCAPGFTGAAQKHCVAESISQASLNQARLDQYGLEQPTCAVRGFLDGCVVAEPCAELIIEDSCMFAAPSCNAAVTPQGLVLPSLAAGQSCEVICKSPYKAASSRVSCAETNTNTSGPPVWSPLSCELDCPNVDPPVGIEAYFENASTEAMWRCSAGFIGTASRVCRLLDGCQSETIFSGCSRLLPCRAFVTDLCGVNGSSCQSLQPGESCQITCVEGHVGGPFSAECPAGNIIFNRALQFAELPACQRIFPPDGCYEPTPWPEGYVLNGSVWICAEGYVGTPVETCTPMEPCGQATQLSGCLAEQPCAALVLQSCRYEAIGCSGLTGGQACEIRCKSPAEGPTVSATCPEENTNPQQELVYNLPSCTIPSCPNPSPITAGYMEIEENGTNVTNATTTLACADKFAGQPEVVCIFTNDCQPLARLEGCNPLVPCVGPAELDECKFSVNLCEDGPLTDVPGGNDGYRTVKPGGHCAVSCRGRFVGTTTTGTCPLNNTDPWHRLDFAPPLSCECPDDLAEWPEGYNQTGVTSNTGPLQEGAWYCEEGYGGTPQISCEVLAGCVPLLVFDGCAPLQRCRPMNMSNPPCQYDISLCNRTLDGGENCEVSCRLPAVGQAVNASCPEDNTVPDQELMTAIVDPVSNLITAYRPFEFPLCETPSFCPDPVPMEPGYNRSGVEGGPAEGNYECDEGFSESPKVTRRCEMVNSSQPGVGLACLLYPVFEGCLPIVNCTGIDERMVDTCRYDISKCPETFEPGETCEVSCRQPFYIGTQMAYASCPKENTDPLRQIIVDATEQTCAKACPEVDPVPGYEKVNGQWQCSPGYLGTALADCEVISIYSSVTRSSVCEARVALSGCSKMATCVPPTLDQCIYDVSDCNGVLSGTNCSIRCRSPPYEGIASNASCPNGNLDPLTVVDVVPPNCTLRCPPPAPQDMLNGYNYTDGVYVCLDGWFGVAQAECLVNEDCTFGVSLTGCGQSSPCIGLNESAAAGTCFYDVTPQACSLEDPTFPQANFGRGPGGSCTVSCRPPCSPQEGQAFFETLVCPASNLNAQLPLQGNLPNCSFDCDPLDRQGGYSKGADGEWTCAEGFAGEVVPLCWSGEVCEDQMMLTGCLPEQPCVPPIIEVTPCFYDTSSCQGVPAGGSCFVRCAAPYYLGSIRPATCPSNNTDPLGPAVLNVRPVCNWNPAESCPDPAVPPEGYAFDVETGTWVCGPGYAGEAMRNCALRPVANSQQCTPEAVLSGCFPLTPCIEPQTRDCKYNTTAAGNLTPGSIGLIYCNVPFDGIPTQAQCPWDNNQAGQEPQYGLPVCEAACPKAVGQPTPPGFVWIEADKEWQCLPGYRSPAQVNCTTNIACEWMLDYGGCEKLEPCLDLNISSCVVDTSSCSNLQEGDTCVLSCIPPFFLGSSTIARCPTGNIDPEKLPDYTMPNCEVTCPDPTSPPAGYEKANANFGAWQCAAGYSGTANKSCHTTSYDEGCITSTVLTGCLPIVPCKDPDPRTQPPCYYDTSNCYGISAGTSCSITCLAPYVGTVGSASCAINNTDPFRPLVWTWPECSLDPCPDPAVIPAGYVKEAGTWNCTAGFVGSASISCVASPIEPGAGVQCNVSSLLSGCLGKMPCAPLPLDACMLDSSNCSDGVPAGGSCDVLCKSPYVGTPGEATCPEINTDPNFLPTLQSPMCMVDCSELVVQRVGYRLKSNDTGAGWECDDGYSGIVKEECFLEFDGTTPCGTPALLLSGCRPLVDCVAPMVDLCQFDVSLCQAVSRGNSCSISCRLPYMGTSKTAMCPLNNTDALQGLQVDLPSCSFSICPDPAQLPLGYVLHANGSYTCDRDYIGSVVRRCSAFSPLALGNSAQGPDCYTEAVFSGCKVVAEIVPCQPPVVNPCLHNATSCAGSALQPGGSCEVGCLLPYYQGSPSMASCPLDNINTTGGLEWSAPQCSLFCPEPTLQEEPAYGRNPAGGSNQDSSGWICNPGYAGTAQVFCKLLPPAAGARCGVARLQMSGCSRLEPCVPLLAADLDFQVRVPAAPPSRDFLLQKGEGFELEVAPSCSALAPGESCLVGCRWPFMGQVAAASCPVGNTDRFQVPLLERAPFCELRCPDPLGPPPEGYRLVDPNQAGQWQCTPDYTGDPLKYCNASSACNETGDQQLDSQGNCANAVELEISFSGCAQRQPCSGPDVSSCQLESFDCAALLAPGASCSVRCRFPFQGQATEATCPRDNILLDGRGLVWQPPNCILPECYDPVPPGYQFNSAGWTCSAGFFGTARQSCSTDRNCEEEIVLTGCQQLQPCRVPMSNDRCRYDYSACRSTLDGNTCEIRCLSPFYTSPQVGLARCPAGNVNPEQELEVVLLPNCEAVCNEPPPLGYRVLDATPSSWQCAEGYLGNPEVSCSIQEVDDGCRSSATFSGCAARTACTSPKAKADGCIYELLGCDSIAAGTSSCEIGCKHPYRGSTAVASCPDNNTDPLRPADVVLPDCVVKAPCPDPPEGVPAAYRYTGNVLDPVACATGYVGPALRQCIAKALPDSNNTCFAEGNFTGCEPIVPCVAPKIGSTDCVLEHDCPDIMPAGSSCEIRCKQPLRGESSTARCPWNNTQFMKVADWNAPVCRCPDPELIPPGYQAATDDEWTCLAGFVGRAQKICPCGGEVSILTGCYAPIVCGASGFTDTDMRKGFVGGELKFGPSTIDNRNDEDGVFRYQVFWADDCGVLLPNQVEPILSLPPRTGGGFSNLWPVGCCKSDVYTATLAPLAMPAAARTLVLQVLTSSGPAADALVVPLVDENYEVTVTDPPKGTVGRAARLAHPLNVFVLFALGYVGSVRQSSLY